MKRRERKTESVYLRMPQSLRRVVEAEAERQGRGLADTLRIIFTLTADLFKNWKIWCEQRNNPVGTERA
ncbi:MAG: hypothetical protein WCD67_15530, partial [Xanthobacteraceae bacterium]